MMEEYKIPELSREQFHKFAEIVHRVSHITLKENKITLLANRLRKRMRDLSLGTYEEYFRYLTGENSGDEISLFLEVITTNETYFWRTTSNFEILKTNILPSLFLNYPSRSLSLWAAGCSTGEEPYNIAMELIESMKDHGIFDFKIRASDISRRVIDFAQKGTYSGRKIEKIPPLLLGRYFRQEKEFPGHYTVRRDLKERIEFVVEDLFSAEVKGIHCIFCRNVMIYFSQEDQEELVARFYRSLEPGGFLVIGHAESLHILKNEFTPHHFPGGVVYQKLVPAHLQKGPAGPA